MVQPSAQGDLFAPEPALPDGLAYRPDFVTAAEEADLVAIIRALPLRAAQYRSYEARRRILSFGSSYDFSRNRLEAAPPVPEFLLPLRERVGDWLAIPPTEFAHALLTEYVPGTPIGWHRDTPDFEVVVGISLAGRCRMRFRPYPHIAHRSHANVELELAPRSAYVIRGPARWRWQHHIPPTVEHRYSITLRTHAQRGERSQRKI
ncbi:MAG TPA: alpha-ketoglutarate-dependent dioxygenase AlkB [Burkholderiales bacterium]|nr:alpha-ketoglutarate-dependent dioxygenase AlkB [Burkholderiales bacterium]